MTWIVFRGTKKDTNKGEKKVIIKGEKKVIIIYLKGLIKLISIIFNGAWQGLLGWCLTGGTNKYIIHLKFTFVKS